MMPQSINKKKIYFYLLILLFLSSTFNFNIVSKFEKLSSISNIYIEGLSKKEKSIIEKKLEVFINKNIFLISREDTEKIFETNSFIDSYNITKIFPSKILVNVKKTKLVGMAILDGEKFYIGKNGKLIEVSSVEKEYNLPQVFGNFKVHEFLNLQEILNSNGFNIQKIKNYYYFKSKRWDIENSDNVTLKLPSQNIEKSLKNYKTLLKSNKIISGQLIDLRLKNKIILSDGKR